MTSSDIHTSKHCDNGNANDASYQNLWAFNKSVKRGLHSVKMYFFIKRKLGNISLIKPYTENHLQYLF